ncbi:MAG TPA: copper resistance protein CopC [Candidatus Saccharimonadales bacterium]|nr:copper resistance protein CopC [Candidatus Saccharimonadales bacterium]
MKTNSIQRWAVAIALVLTGPSLAWAHAFLDHAEPKVGSVVAISPGELKLWFTQRLEPAFSWLQVQDASGQEVDKKNAHLDADDKSLLIVSLPQLPAGTYTVIWHAVSVDTHKTQGRFKFTVKQHH